MVVATATPIKMEMPHVPFSLTLKFGMDRILSGTNVSGPRELQGNCTRCLSIVQMHAHRFNQAIYVPQPLRPYTNVVSNDASLVSSSQQKRKRSWSRAVFSNLQRKGLEKRFQLQKYITKPDRRQLAATLGLSDAQVKVWFQNRRMKWRHTKEGSKDESANKKMKAPASKKSESDCESVIDVQTIDSD